MSRSHLIPATLDSAGNHAISPAASTTARWAVRSARDPRAHPGHQGGGL